jgi:hypothetical protein
MMKISLKSYGAFILLGVVANIFIFYFFSKQLEEYVYHKVADKYVTGAFYSGAPSGQVQNP